MDPGKKGAPSTQTHYHWGNSRLRELGLTLEFVLELSAPGPGSTLEKEKFCLLSPEIEGGG